VTRLSLCMIAKNEGTMLADCLASVRGLVDEIVLADTGSDDDTVAIAEAAGATVVRHAWSQDFAAARNAALAAVTGDWVLMLDADERLTPGAAAAIRKAIADDDLDCGLLPLHNAARLDAPLAEVLSGKARIGEPTALPRLLRRTPTLRWTGVVHESVAAWLTEINGRVRHVGAHILHLGSVPSIREARDKWNRNVSLLERRVELEPDNPVPFGYLATELAKSGQMARAAKVASDGWQAWLRVADRPGPRPSITPLATLHAQILLATDRIAEARAVIEHVRTRSVRHVNLDWLEGRACMRELIEEGAATRSLLERADAAFTLCLEARGRPFAEEPIPGATGWASYTDRGVARLLAGRSDAAFADFQAALADNPKCDAARLGRVEAWGELGDYQKALTELEPLLTLPAPDPWVLGAWLTANVGEPGDAAPFLHRARELLERGFLAPHRRATLDATAALADMWSGRPRPGPGPLGTLGALLARLPVPGPNQSPVPVPLACQLARHYVNTGRTDLLSSLLEPRAEALSPGLGDAVRETLSQAGVSLDDDARPQITFVTGDAAAVTAACGGLRQLGGDVVDDGALVSLFWRLGDDWGRALGRDLEEAGLTRDIIGSIVSDAIEAALVAATHAGAPVIVAAAELAPAIHRVAALHPGARVVWLGDGPPLGPGACRLNATAILNNPAAGAARILAWSGAPIPGEGAARAAAR
jgi:tetratricopeptide (TPR) repeat protein